MTKKKKFYDEQGNEVSGVKVKKPIYKKVWFWVLAVIVFFIVVSSGGKESASKDSVNKEVKTEASTTGSDTTGKEVEEEVEKTPREHKNALSKAESYLSWAGMSEEGLRNQLEFEEFPEDAINYALENVDADYNEQALEKAKSYDGWASMSDQGLKDQLLFEGFTEEQAQYAIDNLD